MLDEKTGRISGTPNAEAGAAQFTLRVRDSAGKTASRSLVLEVRAPLSVALPDSGADFAVGDTIDIGLAATGGAGSYTWTLAAGSLLPPGVEFHAGAARLQGTLFQTGDYRLTLLVRDSSGAEAPAATALQVAPQLVLATSAGARAVTGSTFSLPLPATGGPHRTTFVSLRAGCRRVWRSSRGALRECLGERASPL